MPALPAATFTTASIDYAALAPVLVVVGTALLGVLVEAFVPRAARYVTQVALTLVGLVAAFLVLVLLSVHHQTATAGVKGSTGVILGSVVVDGPALFLQGTILVFAVLGVLTMAERLGGRGADAFTPMGAATPGSPAEALADRAGAMTSEVFPLTLFAVVGMLLFPAAGDLLTMFIALEVLSLPLYILTGLARRRRLLSQEASLKYFLLGAFSSAFFLFGSALLFGFAGSVYLPDIAEAIGTSGSQLDGLLLPGVVLVAVGLLFKVGAVPFHAWTPDVYQGAPTPVTGFMAAATKLAAFGAILRLVYVGIAGDRWSWAPGIAAVAILTMVVGAVLSVTQTDVKRLLAYSSIAHAGFILTGVLAFDKVGVGGVMFYLVAYGLATIAAFGIVGIVRADGAEATHLSQWAGLGKRHPWTATAFAFLLLAFAGIPLTSGFTSKFAVFAPALRSGGMGTTMVVVGLVCSAITVFVYARVIVLMYFTDRADGAADNVAVVSPSAMTTVAITFGAALTLVLGVWPSQLLQLANDASQFIR
ncbi:NADH-quinone oxidoreductase subunit NuoN [Lapillicoccus jejuensis]|uniref:NADH-quinone oxidoreductase subunit N n=1 Tax=Lapillicoccus jejuensis TaxID=402171 RepID=A0A542DX15_9MICO|nr:NADH-quinone oxidoreductase subunit NuoN [Lapillicoccus jejuensis]TQJ07631.1 NADH dehydrogenase subunit N [Lapillicoccus jejuensis]